MRRAFAKIALLFALQCGAAAQSLFTLVPPHESDLNRAGAEGYRFVLSTDRGYLMRRAGSAAEPYRFRVVQIDQADRIVDTLNLYGAQSYELVTMGFEAVFEKGPTPRNHSFYLLSAQANHVKVTPSDWKIISHKPLLYEYDGELRENPPALPVPALARVTAMRAANRLKNINSRGAEGFRWVQDELMVADDSLGTCEYEYGSATSVDDLRARVENISSSGSRIAALDLYGRLLIERCSKPSETSEYRVAAEDPDRAALFRELEDAWNDGFTRIDSSARFKGRLVVLTEKRSGSLSRQPASATRKCAAEQAERLCVPSGTPVLVEMLESVRSDAKPQPTVLHYRIVEDVWADGRLVLAKGCVAEAAIRVTSSGRAWRDAKVAIVSFQAKCPNGAVVPLRFAKPRLEPEKTKTSAGERVASGALATVQVGAQNPLLLVAAPLAMPFFLLKKGRPVAIDAGERYELYVASDTVIPTMSAPDAPDVVSTPPASPKSDAIPPQCPH